MERNKALDRGMDRRQFLRASGAAAATMLLSQIPLKAQEQVKRGSPNFLWISTEDMSPNLGCYGDSYAVTPNIDEFAREGVLFSNAFTHGPVCAPTRSGIITGVYPTSIGAQNMRCSTIPPAHVKCFTEYLRAAGYYCTNNLKTDYQFDAPVTAWDQCSSKGHWRQRAKGQNFFAVFNLHTTGEARTRDLSENYQAKLAAELGTSRHDPAKAPLPPYYPDTPTVRRDMTQYYDNITLMDREFAKILEELEADGLADDTIVWFWADHGRGLPRAQRWVYDSGIRFPLIVRVPEKWQKTVWGEQLAVRQPGSISDELVGTIDFAPTMLSLAAMEIPDYMHGRAFMGRSRGKERDYIYAARDRMDEAIDVIRAVRDKRYKYIRNYMPHLTYGQNIAYMDMMPTMQEMRRLNAEGKLTGSQKNYFLENKPVEELYDTAQDPHEINNLAGDAAYKEILERMRAEHQRWAKETGDTGLIPEPELNEMIRPGGRDSQHWKDTLEKTDLLERLRAIKDLDFAADEAIPAYTRALADKYASVRYWAVTGLYHRCKTTEQIAAARPDVLKMMKDASATVRIAAAEALCGWEDNGIALAELAKDLKNDSEAVRLYAITSLDRLGEKARPALEDIRTAAEVQFAANVGSKLEYVRNVARKVLARLEKSKT